MRKVRRHLNAALSVAGIIIVLSAVLFVIELRGTIVLVLLGLIMIQAGTWNLAQPLLPEERRYIGLRQEVDNFIGLVRHLNRVAVEEKSRGGEPERGVEGIRGLMDQSLRRMVELAGKTDEELEKERPPQRPRALGAGADEDPASGPEARPGSGEVPFPQLERAPEPEAPREEPSPPGS